MTDLAPLNRLKAGDFETPAILKKTATASRKLAELKGLAASIPNQGILINTLGMQDQSLISFGSQENAKK